MKTTSLHNPRRYLRRALALGLLLLAFAQLLSAATSLSATVDEGFHITSGYEYLRTGKLRLFDEHTPVAKALFAWPLLFVDDLPPPEEAAGYEGGDLIGVAQATVLDYTPIDRIIVASRIPVTLLTLLLAATVYRWASHRFDTTAGLLALTLFTLDPNILAHGSLATTDLGAMAFITWAIFAFTRYLQNPFLLRRERGGTVRARAEGYRSNRPQLKGLGRRPAPAGREDPDRRKGFYRWLAAALLLGLAQGAKLTALLLYPVLAVLILLDLLRYPREERWQVLWRYTISYTLMVLLSLVVLWGLYSFEVRPLPGHNLPLPATSHIERWLRLQENLDYGRETFLLGQNSMFGWWQYFPVALLVKTPLPTLIMLVIVLVSIAYCVFRSFFPSLIPDARSSIPDPRSLLTIYSSLLLFPALYAVASLTSTINIGYRHLLPILPFLYVALADEVSRLTSHVSRFTSHVSRIALLVLLIWLTLGTLLISPHYLAYFNAIAGGPENGWRFLADSNTDWGQTFKALAEYQETHDLGPVRLSAFTFYDPAIYGVEYQPLAPITGAPPVLPSRFNPEPGIYAISATTLDGVPLPYPPTYDWFRHREPRVKIGYAMFVYDVEPLEAQWLAQCNTPVAPLSDAAIEEGFGTPTLRRITLDCEQSWVLPDGGQSAGWYAQAIPEQTSLVWPRSTEHHEWWPDWTTALPQQGLELSYVQPTHGVLPAFAIWECAGCTLDVPSGETINLENTLQFQGFIAPDEARPGESIDVLTYWRILGTPTEPLSLMLHLTAPDGHSIAIGDALGFPVEQWQPGDLLVQRHQLEIPPETPSGNYTLTTGAYRLTDLQLLETGDLQRVLRYRITIESGSSPYKESR